jgi:dihydrofolate synthase/folylpolyglutamate synthase
MKLETLADWLSYLESLHPTTIELGLDRVNRVKQALSLEPQFPIIMVGGTNGKGSASAMLEAILSAAGYRVGCYTSPHLLAYNERVRVNRTPLGDEILCHAFAAVEAARGDISLTYFEFGTLAAMWHFLQASVDVAVLEVGLGGRLDAVNIFDADCAIVTSVALDHMDYLGDTREAIGFEKAGIFRAGRPAIYGEDNPPQSLLDHAQTIGAKLQLIGQDFWFGTMHEAWQFQGQRASHHALPYPALRGAYQLYNASACLAALDELRDRLTVSENDIRRGLLEVVLPGRFQVLPGYPAVILDVAHNPHAAQALAANLAAMPCTGKTIAVFAMLSDKDIAGVVHALKDIVHVWIVAQIQEKRGASLACLKGVLDEAGLAEQTNTADSVTAGFEQACRSAGENDRILVFGSFYTVADVLTTLA